MNHTPNCAFSVSFGDEGCDCDGQTEAPAEPGTLSPTAREHLALAREALRAQGAKA